MATLKEIILELQDIASKQPSINQILDSGNIYDINNLHDIQPSVFCITQINHIENIGSYMTYNLVLYYVDREKSDGSNRLDIQSMAIQVLSNIINTFLSNNEMYDATMVQYTTFVNSFSWVASGAYATLSINVPIGLCKIEY